MALEVRDRVVEFSFSRVCFVELMVARTDQVDLLLFGNLVRELSTGLGRVVDGVSFNTVASVDE